MKMKKSAVAAATVLVTMLVAGCGADNTNSTSGQKSQTTTKTTAKHSATEYGIPSMKHKVWGKTAAEKKSFKKIVGRAKKYYEKDDVSKKDKEVVATSYLVPGTIWQSESGGTVNTFFVESRSYNDSPSEEGFSLQWWTNKDPEDVAKIRQQYSDFKWQFHLSTPQHLYFVTPLKRSNMNNQLIETQPSVERVFDSDAEVGSAKDVPEGGKWWEQPGSVINIDFGGFSLQSGAARRQNAYAYSDEDKLKIDTTTIMQRKANGKLHVLIVPTMKKGNINEKSSYKEIVANKNVVDYKLVDKYSL